VYTSSETLAYHVLDFLAMGKRWKVCPRRRRIVQSRRPTAPLYWIAASCMHLQDCARCILGAEQQLGRTAEEHSLRYKAVRVSERVGTLVSPCHGRADGGLRYYLRIHGRLAQHAATSASRAICTHTGTACNPKSQKTAARKEEDVESVRLSMLISRVEPSQPPPCRFGQTHGYLFPLTTNDKLTSSHCSP
jgi:hypothetical protein